MAMKRSNMRLVSVSLALLSLLSFTTAASEEHHDHKHAKKVPGPPPSPKVSCTLTASGGDDAPNFLAAVNACPTITIPQTTTLNISTRLNMTGLQNKHIVSYVSLTHTKVFLLTFCHQNLQGTIKFNPNIPYWTGVRFKSSKTLTIQGLINNLHRMRSLFPSKLKLPFGYWEGKIFYSTEEELLMDLDR